MNYRTLLYGANGLSRASAVANQLLVAAYKILGFVILTVVLLGIAGFAIIHALYVVHRAWLAPAVISPTDPAVLDLRARIAEERWKREQVQGERLAIRPKLERLRMVARLEQDFQRDFQAALAADTTSHRSSLTLLGALNQERHNVATELRRVGTVLESSSVGQLREEFDAKLIDKQKMLQSSYQLAQLAQTRLDLQQREVELGDRIRRTEREIESLAVARSGATSGKRLTYEGLVLRREHDRSLAESAGAHAEVEALEAALADLERTVAHYDELIATLREAPLLRATEQQLALAFVPYDNQGSMREGRPLYGCRLFVVGCHEVGRVKRYLPGEHRQNHPVYGNELRGQLAELELDDPEWAKASVLHGGRPPLFL